MNGNHRCIIPCSVSHMDFDQSSCSKAYSKPSRTFRIKIFVKIVNNFQPLTILQNAPSNVRLSSEYASNITFRFWIVLLLGKPVGS